VEAIQGVGWFGGSGLRGLEICDSIQDDPLQLDQSGIVSRKITPLLDLFEGGPKGLDRVAGGPV
jgi:hypothetical protein